MRIGAPLGHRVDVRPDGLDLYGRLVEGEGPRPLMPQRLSVPWEEIFGIDAALVKPGIKSVLQVAGSVIALDGGTLSGATFRGYISFRLARYHAPTLEFLIPQTLRHAINKRELQGAIDALRHALADPAFRAQIATPVKARRG